MIRLYIALPALAWFIAIVPTARADPDEIMKAMDGFRREIPPPQGLNAMNGLARPDADGKSYTRGHLVEVADRLGAKSQADYMVLLTYLTDRDWKIRRIAAEALDSVVKAYPNGLTWDALDKLDSDQHRKMVKAFVDGIEKLPK